MKHSLLIIVSGPICSGKSTLAKKLSEKFLLPLITKDEIKESLFDNLGWSDREWSKKIGKASINLLYYFLRNLLLSKKSVIIESNFKSEFDSLPISDLVVKHGYFPIQILCQCDGQILFERFKQRSESGRRHPGHVDQVNSEEFKDTLLLGKSDPLKIGGEVITFDTTNFDNVDYENIFSKISLYL